MKSYPYLQDHKGLRLLEGFRYRQINHYISSLIGKMDHLVRPFTHFELSCYNFPAPRGLILDLYQSLTNPIVPTKLIMTKLETGLGQIAVSKCSPNTMAQENAYELPSTWHLTPNHILIPPNYYFHILGVALPQGLSYISNGSTLEYIEHGLGSITL